MRKTRLFNLARKRHTTMRWAAAGFAVATLALFAAPDMASTIGRATQVAAVAPSAHKTLSAIPAANAPRLARVSCSDFDNQAEAQAFLAAHTVSDPRSLDADNNGIVCEHLP